MNKRYKHEFILFTSEGCIIEMCLSPGAITANDKATSSPTTPR